MRMVVGIHGRTANSRPNAQVTLAAGLAQLNIAMLDIADLSNRGQAFLPDEPFFAGRQPNGGIVAVFFGQDLSGCAGRTNDLTASSGL
jgi:hypothetical protein